MIPYPYWETSCDHDPGGQLARSDLATRVLGQRRRVVCVSRDAIHFSVVPQSQTTFWETGNGDYSARTGTLTFAPGETTKAITIAEERKRANSEFGTYSSGGKRPSKSRFSRSITREGSLMFRTWTVTMPVLVLPTRVVSSQRK